MLRNPLYEVLADDGIADLVQRHGWATLVSEGAGSFPVVSHLPVVLDHEGDGLAVLGHLARSDAEEHHLGDRHAVLIVAGPHGYISPTLYGDAGPFVPTWDFVVAHLGGVPELLDEDGTWRVLERTCAHFEHGFTQPWQLAGVSDYAASLVPHVTGFRLRPTQVQTKVKVSQDKPAEVVARVLAGLERPGEYANPDLAAAMRAYGEE